MTNTISLGNNNSMSSCVALVPRGLEHVVEEMARLQLSPYPVTIKLLGEKLTPDEIPLFIEGLREKLIDFQVKENKKRRRSRQGAEGTCSSSVGTVQVSPNQHVSIGYCCGNVNVWTQVGQLQGTVWLEIRSTASVMALANMRCLGPLLALVDVSEDINLDEEHTLEETTRQIQQATADALYTVKFQSALRVWGSHVQECWPGAERTMGVHEIVEGTAPLKYRLSCMRTESKKYTYGRRLLLTSVDFLLPKLYSHWSVDLVNYDVEIVLLQRSHSFSIGLALRPYQLLPTRSFATGVLPPDVSPPYLSGTALLGLVRLRPTTAQVLLHLAQLLEGDIVLDPCAGIGTIPIESHIRRHHTVIGIGGDLVLTDPMLRSLAIKYSIKACNLQRSEVSGKTVESDVGCTHGRASDMVAWDATNLPIRAHTIDVVVSDLPFGQQCMSASKLDVFLPLLLTEMARVLRPTTGRMVLLCGSYVPIVEALKRANDYVRKENSAGTGKATVWQLPCTAVFPVNVGGHLAWVIQVGRGASEAAQLPRHTEQVKAQVRKRERTEMLTKRSGKTKRPQT